MVQSAFDVSYTTWLIICTAYNQKLFLHNFKRAISISQSTQPIICSLSVRGMEGEGKEAGREKEKKRDRERSLLSSMVLTGFVALFVCGS